MTPTLDLRPKTAETPLGTQVAPIALPVDRPVIMWEAPEYHAQPKTTLWYVAFGVVMALLLFVAFLMQSFLTGVVFALLGLLILLYSERRPRTATFRITPTTLVINDRRYLLRELDAFNVVESPSSRRPDSPELGHLLLIRSRRLVMPLLHVPLGDQDPETIREALAPRLKEDPELREPLADLLFHWIGF